MNENSIIIDKPRRITRILVGFLLIFIALIGLINVGYVGQTITIMFTFIFGWVAYWFLFPIFIILGLYLVIRKKAMLRIRRNFDLAAIGLIIISLSLLATVFFYYPSNPDPRALNTSNFIDQFWQAWRDATKTPFVNSYLRFDPFALNLNGGFFGFLFVALINSGITAVGSICIGFVILFVALIILLHKPIKLLFRKIINKNKHKEEAPEPEPIPSITPMINVSEPEEKKVEIKPTPAPTFTPPTPESTPIQLQKDETFNAPLSEANIFSSDDLPNDTNNDNGFEEGIAKPAMIGEDEKFESTNQPKILPPYVKPGYNMLEEIEVSDIAARNEEHSKINTEIINRTFQDLKIGAKAISHTIGPRVTRYDIQMDVNASLRSIPQFVLDISQRLGGVHARFEPIVTGKITSGLEVPNMESEKISFKEVISALPDSKKVPLAIPFGKNISGEIKTADLAGFPHMLIAGATGSGKTVFVHSIIMSIIMRNTPDDVRLLLIDPKRVEFTKYKNTPFLLCPTVTDPKKAQVALKKLCEEMDRRYGLFEEAMVNQIKPYNAMMRSTGKAPLPYIVTIVDEFADLISQNKKIDIDINRVAAKARAAGIHLIIATQRPSVDVITGTVKANLPVRVALSVPDQESSKTILGGQGAETLLGHGDMLVNCPQIQSSGNFRCQGCYVSDEEIERVVKFINAQREPHYDQHFMDLEDHQVEEVQGSETKISAADARAKSDEELYQFVKEQTYKREYTSISLIERENGIGFTRAGRMFKRLQEDGLVSFDNEASKGCKVLKEKFRIEEHHSVAGSAELTTVKSNNEDK